MASTRSSTGSSRPRVHLTVDTGPDRKRTSTVKRGRKAGTTTKSTTTTKPRATTGAGVKKRGRPVGSTKTAAAPATHHKRKSHLSDKVEGVADKIVGTVTRQPGKKAAGTKKIRGTDGKNARGRPRKV
ncbi:hypothetical protein SCUP234_09475 [Seiridium cupressi]|uniref:Uncharacterized protein n=2 Tax=Seiridium TaxID=138063 RepID=A0ABR2VD11_9PEZI